MYYIICKFFDIHVRYKLRKFWLLTFMGWLFVNEATYIFQVLYNCHKSNLHMKYVFYSRITSTLTVGDFETHEVAKLTRISRIFFQTFFLFPNVLPQNQPNSFHFCRCELRAIYVRAFTHFARETKTHIKYLLTLSRS